MKNTDRGIYSTIKKAFYTSLAAATIITTPYLVKTAQAYQIDSAAPATTVEQHPPISLESPLEHEIGLENPNIQIPYTAPELEKFPEEILQDKSIKPKQTTEPEPKTEKQKVPLSPYENGAITASPGSTYSHLAMHLNLQGAFEDHIKAQITENTSLYYNQIGQILQDELGALQANKSYDVREVVNLINNTEGSLDYILNNYKDIKDFEEFDQEYKLNTSEEAPQDALDQKFTDTIEEQLLKEQITDTIDSEQRTTQSGQPSNSYQEQAPEQKKSQKTLAELATALDTTFGIDQTTSTDLTNIIVYKTDSDGSGGQVLFGQETVVYLGEKNGKTEYKLLNDLTLDELFNFVATDHSGITHDSLQYATADLRGKDKPNSYVKDETPFFLVLRGNESGKDIYLFRKDAAHHHAGYGVQDPNIGTTMGIKRSIIPYPNLIEAVKNGTADLTENYEHKRTEKIYIRALKDRRPTDIGMLVVPKGEEPNSFKFRYFEEVYKNPQIRDETPSKELIFKPLNSADQMLNSISDYFKKLGGYRLTLFWADGIENYQQFNRDGTPVVDPSTGQPIKSEILPNGVVDPGEIILINALPITNLEGKHISPHTDYRFRPDGESLTIESLTTKAKAGSKPDGERSSDAGDGSDGDSSTVADQDATSEQDGGTTQGTGTQTGGDGWGFLDLEKIEKYKDYLKKPFEVLKRWYA